MSLYEVAAHQLNELGEELMKAMAENVRLEAENDQLRRTVEDLKARLKAPPY